MLFTYLFIAVSSAMSWALGLVALIIDFAFPSSVIDTYWSAVETIFSGVRILDVILPVSELLILAGIGIGLRLITTVAVNGWGLARMAKTFIFFWKK